MDSFTELYTFRTDHTLKQGETHLPGLNISCGLCKWSLEGATHLEGIGANLCDVVEQGPQSRRWKHSREQEDITELNKHLQVVIQGALREQEDITKLSKHLQVVIQGAPSATEREKNLCLCSWQNRKEAGSIRAVAETSEWSTHFSFLGAVTKIQYTPLLKRFLYHSRIFQIKPPP